MNILISRHDKIGDFITTLPLFYVVKKAYPEAKIYALVSKVNVELAQQFDFIDMVILYDKSNFWHTLTQIRQAKINISISAFIDNKLGWLLFLSQIKNRIAPATKLAQIFFNNTLKQRRSKVEKTEVLYNLDLAKKLNKHIDLNYKKPLLKLNNNANFRKKHQLKDKKIIIFHPGFGGSSDGNLPLADYIKLAEIANKEKGVQVVFTFGPDDVQTQKIMPLLDNIIIYQPPNLLDFCHLIADSELLISTSTGPMHLAGALNVKTISIFGKTLFASPKRWATVSEKQNQHNFVINTNAFSLIKTVLFKMI